MNSAEKVTRGSMPHWYKPGFAHFVTYRLAGSIPVAKVKAWRGQRRKQIQSAKGRSAANRELRERAHKSFFARYDEHLDRNAAVRWLQQPVVAEVVRENLYHHHGSRFELIAWCIMPNHVHVVLQPFESSIPLPVADAGSLGETTSISEDDVHSDEVRDSVSVLSRIMHSLKSYTANRANEVLNRSGSFWQTESYDHWIRDVDELERIVDYVRLNPVKSGLCEQPQQWRYSSACERFQTDGSTCGLVGWLRDDWRR